MYLVSGLALLILGFVFFILFYLVAIAQRSYARFNMAITISAVGGLLFILGVILSLSAQHLQTF